MTLRGRRVSYEMQVRDGHTSRAAWGTGVRTRVRRVLIGTSEMVATSVALDVDERRAVKPDDSWGIPAIVHGENSRPEL